MNTTDPRLKDLFAERSQRVHVVGDLAERAIARDRANRRREVTTAVAVGAVALAVAVPVGWNATRPDSVRPVPAVSTSGGLTSTEPAPSPSQSTSQSTTTDQPTDRPTSIPTITLSGAPAAATLAPSADPSGPAGDTAVAYVIDGELHDGLSRITLPDALARPAQVARLADRLVLLVTDDGVTVVDASGAVLTDLPGGRAVAVSSDRTHFILTGDTGDLTYHDARGRQLAQLPAATCKCGSDGGAPSAYQAAVGLVGTTAYAAKGYTGTTVAWDVETGATKDLPGQFRMVDSERAVAVVQIGGATGENPCYDLRDLATNARRWRVCGPVLMQSFSLDGQYVVGTGAVDGLRSSVTYPTVLVWRTTDGELLLESGDPTGPGPWSVSARAATGQDIAVQVGHEDGTRSLQRCTLEGRCEVIAPARPRWQSDIPEGDDPYILATN
ncbi:hypothetical protein [Intrasporangium calvum]|uniref:hypothetical protein n=1 Tax=Intrasporangium calvum TaxID=53358 RepID=UPI000DF5C552|nr:hypothetical protein [Intrasporangium calvum]AXG14945.1 hypothetical protein DN585_17400 [Intrasporangium calvum]